MPKDIYKEIKITPQLLLVLTGDDAPMSSNLAKTKRVQLMQSAWNGIIAMADKIGCDASDLAISLEPVLPMLPHILTHVKKSFEAIREACEEADFDFDPHVWDPINGIPGHTEKLIDEAIKAFPIEIRYETLGERHQGVTEQMAQMIRKLAPDSDEAKKLLANFEEMQGGSNNETS